jgi:hypothetical protein
MTPRLKSSWWALDAAPAELDPTYETWIKRREHWLPALVDADQFQENRV